MPEKENEKKGKFYFYDEYSHDLVEITDVKDLEILSGAEQHDDVQVFTPEEVEGELVIRARLSFWQKVKLFGFWPTVKSLFRR